jgi:hypothetical protein
MKAKRPLLDHFQSPCHQTEVVPLFGPAVRLTTAAAPQDDPELPEDFVLEKRIKIDAGQRLSRTFDPSPCQMRRAARLRDAGNFIAGLPKREHETFTWRAAVEALMLVVERGGDAMLPRVGIMRALYRQDGADAAQEAGEEVQDRRLVR